MKKLLATLLCIVMCISCMTALADEPLYIGIIQQMDHVALNAARDGFIKALEDNGYVDGQNIKLNIQNGQGEMSNLATIADLFVGDNADLVLAIATNAATTMATKTINNPIPVLGTAITDYVQPGLVESNEKPGYNISGTSDMNPVDAQIKLIKELFPETATVGVLYTSSEANSVLQAKMAKDSIEALGMKYVEVTVANTNDVQQATQQIVSMCDAIYIPTDNVFAASMPGVLNVTQDSKTPVITGESGMAMAGGLCTLGISYYDLGYETGLMAVKVLQGANISEMPIQFATTGFEYCFNKTVADLIGFEIPEQYLPYAQEMAE